MRLDFQEIKARIPIEQVAHVLLPDLKESNGEIHQYRAACPQCKAGGDRAIAVTPGRGFFCNADKRGGDVIGLVSHVSSLTARQAAEWLVEKFQNPPATPPVPSKEVTAPEAQPPGDLQPLKDLQSDHELVTALMPKEVAEAVGIGYANKGLMRSFVAVPVRLPSGKLIGYIGVKEGKTPKTWKT